MHTYREVETARMQRPPALFAPRVSLGTKLVSRYFRRRVSPTRSLALAIYSPRLSSSLCASANLGLVLPRAHLSRELAITSNLTIIAEARAGPADDVVANCRRYSHVPPSPLLSSLLLSPCPLLLLFCRLSLYRDCPLIAR